MTSGAVDILLSDDTSSLKSHSRKERRKSVYTYKENPRPFFSDANESIVMRFLKSSEEAKQKKKTRIRLHKGAIRTPRPSMTKRQKERVVLSASR